MLWLVVGIVAAIIFFMLRGVSGGPPAAVNPNANNPDALGADLDPEGDEPEGY